MVRYLGILLLSFLSLSVFSQFVKNEPLSDSLLTVNESSADWGDYDNDGDLDLVISGNNGNLFTIIYRNDDGVFVDINAGLPGVRFGSVMWGDYDNDQDLDLVVSGNLNEASPPFNSITAIYRNDDGAFVDIGAPLLGVNSGKTRWGDFDGDLDLDLAVLGLADTGADSLRIYRNDDGVFSEAITELDANSDSQHGSVSWGDYDNDMDLDLLITGLGFTPTFDAALTVILRNDDGVFKDSGISLPGVFFSDADWGDYDNDMDLDIAIMGQKIDGTFETAVLENDNGVFTDIAANFGNNGIGSFSGIGSISWEDYDTDGDLDILISGISGETFGPSTKLFRNDGGVFVDVLANIQPVWGFALWGDYDGDNDPDVLISGLDETFAVDLTEVHENVLKDGQVITFDAIADKQYGDVFDLNAVSTSGLSISYEIVDGPATILGSTVTITGVGMVKVAASQSGDSNYNPATTIEQTFNVMPATLTATAEDQTITYGDALPTLTFSYSGFVNGEDVTALTAEPVASTTATAGSSDAGSYEISLDGGMATNYMLNLVNGNLLINKATLTATAEDQTITYGDALPTLTFTYSGFVNGEDVTALTAEPVATTTATAGSDAGSYEISLDGGMATNYMLNLVNGTLLINKATLTATAEDQTITYGDALPTLTFTYSGFVNGEDVTALTAEPVASTTATAGSDTGSYEISLDGGTATNYVLNLVNGNLLINKATLTATAEDQTITYGDALPTLTFSYSGFLNGEDVTALTAEPVASTTATAGSDAGSYEISLDGGMATNYMLNLVNGTLLINKATLTATAEDQTITYGDALPTLTFSYSGFVNGEDENALLSAPTIATNATSASDVGSYTITVSDGSANNYTFNRIDGILTITKADLMITADDKIMNEGEAVPTLTFSSSGFVNGDEINVIDDLPSITTGASSMSSPGTYEITLSGGVDNNYLLILINGILTISEVLSVTYDEAILFFPNPVEDYLVVESPYVRKVEVLDLEGRKLFSTDIKPRIDVSDLRTGIYILSLQDKNGVVLIKKRFVKK
ncbi:MAG: MBG domain-containing protein [Ekhidna sp.]|uniref:MBG domain-containing protein n=1 Tax=Ekhidna sp. TaxID=2608089 RepID=UPI00329A32D6